MTVLQDAYRLGRREALDPRDSAHPMAARLTAPVTRTSRYWMFTQSVLDQGTTATCVGHAWKHLMLAYPVTSQAAAPPSALDLYREATHLDEWDGNEDNLDFGTSVRAGAKALQARGHISGYTWATSVEEAADYILTHGPVIAGTNWYAGMFNSDAYGFLQPQGPVVGGHAYLLIGANTKESKFQMINSWGGAWGAKGRAWLDFDTMRRLLREGGELCAPTEVRWSTR